MQLRALTFNIKTGALSSLETIGAIIARAGADLVGLQEVDQGTRRSLGVDQPARLAELTNMQVTYGVTLSDYDGGRYGIAVLASRKLSLLSTRTHPLPQVEPGEARVALEVALGFEEAGHRQGFTFINTHLDHHSPANRALQAAGINAIASDIGAERHALLVGDMNATEGGETIDILRRSWAPAREQLFGVDWMLQRGERWRVREVRELTPADHAQARDASDHVPVLAEYELGV